MKGTVIVLALLIFMVSANIWDNIFSKTRNVPRVHLDTDFQTQFVVMRNDRQFFVNLDYNVARGIATIDVETEVYLLFFSTKARVAALQANLQTLKAILVTPLDCRNYYIPLTGLPTSNKTTTNSSELLIFYLNNLFEFTHSSQDHYFFLLNPDLLGRFQRNDIPSIGIWIDSHGKVVELIVNHTPISFIAESQLEEYYCQTEPEKLDMGLLERVFEQVKKYI